jgi:hypothetical protein
METAMTLSQLWDPTTTFEGWAEVAAPSTFVSPYSTTYSAIHTSHRVTILDYCTYVLIVTRRITYSLARTSQEGCYKELASDCVMGDLGNT